MLPRSRQEARTEALRSDRLPIPALALPGCRGGAPASAGRPPGPESETAAVSLRLGIAMPSHSRDRVLFQDPVAARGHGEPEGSGHAPGRPLPRGQSSRLPETQTGPCAERAVCVDRQLAVDSSPALDRLANNASPPLPNGGGTPSPKPTKSVKFAPRRNWKRERHRLRRFSGDTIGGRQARCGRKVLRGSVTLLRSCEHGHYFAGLETCGSVWTCPVCAVKITERRRKDGTTFFGAYHGPLGGLNIDFVREGLHWACRLDGGDVVVTLGNQTGHKFPGEISSRSLVLRVEFSNGDIEHLVYRKSHKTETDRPDNRLTPNEFRDVRVPLPDGADGARVWILWKPYPLMPDEESFVIGEWSSG